MQGHDEEEDEEDELDEEKDDAVSAVSVFERYTRVRREYMRRDRESARVYSHVETVSVESSTEVMYHHSMK
jgi:chromatin segregation and condensation protein Rec8/ScpA/Scc1 (kleisin family)